jgi:hypothetical protein
MTRAPAAQELSPPPAGRLTLWQGTALYIGAVLGTGVIALPALAARAAGPASLLAWLGLVLLSVPLAATFASLGAGYPDGGGISTHVRHAFGARAAAVVGWCFYFAVPAGAQAAGMFAGAYVATAVGGGRRTVVIPDGMGMESRPQQPKGSRCRPRPLPDLRPSRPDHEPLFWRRPSATFLTSEPRQNRCCQRERCCGCRRRRRTTPGVRRSAYTRTGQGQRGPRANRRRR